jgi:hypothetical protein
VTDRAAMRRYVEERSIPIPEAGCWLWLASASSTGYGNAWVGALGGVVSAHVVSFLAFRGEVPAGLLVQHSCDNRWCVAPAHLSLGTKATNAEDKRAKGRAAKKLDAATADAIRESTEPSSRLARAFGISRTMVQRIRRGIYWRKEVGQTKLAYA